MAVHDEVLRTAVRICRQRRGWRFRPVEIVTALPHLDPGTVRTHIVSRCCVNAPAHHTHRWPYFERTSRGVYEIRKPYRRIRKASRPARGRGRAVAERPSAYSPAADTAPRDTVHAVVTRSSEWYVGACLEVAVVTQARTLDELVSNLREAVDFHLEDEDPTTTGVVPRPRLSVTYEPPAPRR